MSFIASHKIRAMISYHSAALGVFPGGVPWEPASRRLAAALGKATGYPYPPIDTGCEYTGTLADWAVENGAGAAVDMELRLTQENGLRKQSQGARNALEFYSITTPKGERMTQKVDTLFTNAFILTMDESMTQYSPGAVAIKGDSILAVGPEQDIFARLLRPGDIRLRRQNPYARADQRTHARTNDSPARPGR